MAASDLNAAGAFIPGLTGTGTLLVPQTQEMQIEECSTLTALRVVTPTAGWFLSRMLGSDDALNRCVLSHSIP